MSSTIIPIYQTAQIRELEKLAEERFGISSEVLMQRAGKALLECLMRTWPKARKLAVVCGTGNNGGDGYVLARLARERGLIVTVWQLGDLPPQKEAAQRAYEACQKAKVIIQVSQEELKLNAVDVIVDAISGIGLHSEMRPETRVAIETIAASKLPVLAVDLPSGIDADNGKVWGAAVRATLTLTFIGLKLGLLTGRGVGYAGKVLCHDLQLPTELFSLVKPVAEKLQQQTLTPYLPLRSRDFYKGEAGHVLCVGGELGFSGAIRMAAEGALRVGAGLVTLATRPEHAMLLNLTCPELMCHGVMQAQDLAPLIAKASVIIIGPGLGQSEWAKMLLTEVLKSKLPLVVDADGLNLLAKAPLKKDQWILTPHSGEAARLLQQSTAEIEADRLQAVEALQKQYGGVCVLKGAGTLVQATPELTSLCPYGNAGMASGGMGDILSGVLGALVGQGLSLAEAAKLGVCLHAVAGDRAAKEGGERGTIATDLLPFLRKLVNTA